MAKSEKQKQKLLVLLDILKKYSDNEHGVTLSQISEKLEEEGHIIIQKGRKNIRYYVKDYEDSIFKLD